MMKLEHGTYTYEDQTDDCPNRFKLIELEIGGDERIFIPRPYPGICAICGREPNLVKINGRVV